MADISNDPAKFAPRVRDPKYTQPLRSRESMDAEDSENSVEEHHSPWTQSDQVSLGTPSPSQDKGGEDISPAELKALVEQLKEMKDEDPARIDKVLANLEEGYDPDEVLPTLVQRMLEEGFFES